MYPVQYGQPHLTANSPDECRQIDYMQAVFGYLLRILFSALRAPRVPTGAIVRRSHHRVWPRHVDFNRHMNQAAYAAVCEEARVPWLLDSGCWPQWRAAGIHPVVAEQTLVYRRELAPFQRFLIDTRAVGMDGRLLVIEQHIIVDAKIHTRNRVKLLFIGPDGVLSAADTTDLCAKLLSSFFTVDSYAIHTG